MAPTLRLRRRSLVIETVVTRWRRGARGESLADVAFRRFRWRRDETGRDRCQRHHCATRRRPNMSVRENSKILSLFILGALCAPVEAVVYYGTRLSARTRSVRLTDAPRLAHAPFQVDTRTDTMDSTRTVVPLSSLVPFEDGSDTTVESCCKRRTRRARRCLSLIHI